MEQLSHTQTLIPEAMPQICRAQLKLKVCLLTLSYMKTFSVIRAKGPRGWRKMLITEIWVLMCKFFSAAEVDENTIIAILVKRNNEQRQKIKVVYEHKTGEVCSKKVLHHAPESCQWLWQCVTALLCSAEIGHSSEVSSQVRFGGRLSGPVDATCSFWCSPAQKGHKGISLLLSSNFILHNIKHSIFQL